MPTPGTAFIPESRSAKLFCPLARNMAMTWSRVAPGGRFGILPSWAPMKPSKMMFVARPRIFGPITDSVMLAIDSRNTAITLPRCGASRPTRRLAEGPKFNAFSAGAAPPHGPWPCRPLRDRASRLIISASEGPLSAGPVAAPSDAGDPAAPLVWPFSFEWPLTSLMPPPPPRAGTPRSPRMSGRCRRARHASRCRRPRRSPGRLSGPRP